MNEAEIVKKIAAQKQQKAKDLKLDQHLEFLLFGQANARYWASWESRQPKEWSEKLYELLGLTSMRDYDDGEGEKKLDCFEFVFPNCTFTFKVSNFRSSYWDSDDDCTYGDLYVFYGDKEVASFGLIRGYDKYIGALDPKIVSVDSFIEGDWVNNFNEFVAKSKLFYHWDKDKEKRERASAEAAKLKKKFGITDDEIAQISSTIAKVHAPEANETKKGASFEVDLDRLNEQKKAYEVGEGFGAWIKKNPIASIFIGIGAITLLLLITS